MILTPNTIMPMTALNFLSPDGKCFTFDSRANGYGRGEGIGVVVMKRLSDAIRDNDTIRSVIRGTRVNQDGRTTGITLPSKEAQVANIRGLYEAAGLDFNQTAYVECHGTGTQAGDWRELKAISETLASGRDIDNPIVVGSVKPNIGHLEGAAGIAGLIKGVMVLERGQIPPNINFVDPNPYIDFKEWKVKVPQEVLKWPKEGIRRASVNCFGFGGTNAHVILEEAPAYLHERGLVANHMSLDSRPDKKPLEATTDHYPEPRLFCFSSNEKTGVCRVIKSHIPFVESLNDNDLADYCYTLNSRRSKMEWKAVIVASSTKDLASKMKAFDADSVVRSGGGAAKAPQLCFTFCGQSAQWPRMGEDLMGFQVYRESMEAASHYMKTKLQSPFNLLEEMLKSDDESRISEPDVAQPATTALQIALVELLRSFGITPTHVIGHSSGEIAAAFAAGGLSREAAWEVAYYRGMHAAAVSTKNNEFTGGMIAVGISESEARQYLAETDVSLEVACINSPRSVTLSGHSEAIVTVEQDLKGKDIFQRVLPVSTAYHSKHMGLVAEDYLASLSHLTSKATEDVMMFSSVTGKRVTNAALDDAYWVKNMVSLVNYDKAVREMMKKGSQGPNIFLELSPRCVLKGPTFDIIKSMGVQSPPTYLSAIERKTNGPHSMLEVIGALWVHGQRVDMEKVLHRGVSDKRLKCLTNLPPYPWNHSKAYWHESHLGKTFRFRKYPRQDLIGAPTADSIPMEPRWRGFLRISENPWIQDHQVQKTIVYPAAGMICMVLEGAKQLADEHMDLNAYKITNMRIVKPMLIPDTEHGLEMALNIKLNVETLTGSHLHGSHDFSIYSKQLNAPWEKNATGHLEFHYDEEQVQDVPSELEAKREASKKKCITPVQPRQLYELLETVGMQYGLLFQNITELSKGGDSCVSTVRVPDTKSKMPANFEYPHLIHPATLDSMFQTLFSIDSSPMVPTLLESICVPNFLRQAAPDHYTGFSTARRESSGARADILMQVPNTQSSIEIKGLHLKSLNDSPSDTNFLPNHRNLCTEIVWDEDVAFSRPETLEQFLKLLAYKYPTLTILQVGGTAGLTLRILEVLTGYGTQTAKLARLTIAKARDDLSSLPSSVLGENPLRYYIEERDLKQLRESEQYHLILVCRDAGANVDVLSKHRKTEGYIIECDSFEDLGFTCDAKSRDSSEWPFSSSITERLTREVNGDDHNALRGVVVLYDEEPTGDVNPSGSCFGNNGAFKAARDLEASTLTLMESYEDPSAFKGKVVISFLDFNDDPTKQGFVYHWTEEKFEAFRAVRKAAAGIIWVTKEANMKPIHPHLSSVIGLGRTLMSEDPQKVFVTVDLAADTKLSDDHLSRLIQQIYTRTFQQPGSSFIETEYSLEGGKVYIPRLTTIDPLNRLIERHNPDECQEGSYVSFATPERRSTNKMLKLKVAKPGITDGYMGFVETSRKTLQPHEVELDFLWTILDQSDLKSALSGSSSLGIDFFGRVRRVGSDVHDLCQGEVVSGLVPNGAIQGSAVMSSQLVVPEQQGFIPSHYLDAYYALLRAGCFGNDQLPRRILVLSGSTGRGLAAITLCQAGGYDVYTTVSGRDPQDEKIELIGLTALPAQKVLIVTPASLCSKATEATSGRGFHIVYNPADEFLGPDGGCLRSSGTLVRSSHHAKQDAYTSSLPSQSALIYCSLASLLQDQDGAAEVVGKWIKGILRLFGERQSLFKLPFVAPKDFQVNEVAEALQHLQRGGLDTTVRVHCNTKDYRTRVWMFQYVRTLTDCIDPMNQYILAGGLGGLGRSIAEHLFTNGARNFVFMSRSGATSHQAKDFVKSLEQRGADVRVFQVDLTYKERVMDVVQRCVARVSKGHSIRGVFQCAAVVKDAVFENMTWADWRVAFLPKAKGSLNLVDCLIRMNQHPAFIFLSSSAGVIGNRSQANYAAGNGVEDALARSLRLRGEHATAIDLGPVIGAGMLAEDEATLDILKNNGFYGIRLEDFIKVLEQALIYKPKKASYDPFLAQITLGVGTGGLMLQNQPADPYWSRTALWSHLQLIDVPLPDLAATSTTAQEDMKQLLASAPDSDSAKGIVCTGLMHMLAKAMNVAYEEMDEHKSPTAYGVDSLVAVGVRNWVFTNCAVNVSVFEVLSDKTVGELSAVIADRGGYGGHGREED